MAYVLMIDDNFHHGDTSERYRYGEFVDAGAAVEHCRRIVDEYLQSAYKQGMSASDLLESYTMFGDDPFILNFDDAPINFSAWDYAQERCAQMCREPG